MIKLETFRNGVGLQAGDENDLKLLRATVISLWESTTKRKWNSRTDYEQEIFVGYDGSTQTLLLELFPVDSITSIYERDADEDYEEVDSDDYDLVGRRSVVRRDAVYIGGRRRFWKTFVKVTYTGGVEEADEDVQLALIAQAKFMRSRLAKEQIGTQSQNFEGGSGVMLKPDLHPLFKTLAASKKRKC